MSAGRIGVVLLGIFFAMAWTLHALLPAKGLRWTCIFAANVIAIYIDEIESKFAGIAARRNEHKRLRFQVNLKRRKVQIKTWPKQTKAESLLFQYLLDPLIVGMTL